MAKREGFRELAAVNDIANGLRMALDGARELGMVSLQNKLADLGAAACVGVKNVVTAAVMEGHRNNYHRDPTFCGIEDFAALVPERVGRLGGKR